MVCGVGCGYMVVHLKWFRVNTVIRAGHEVFHVMYALLIRSKITDFVGANSPGLLIGIVGPSFRPRPNTHPDRLELSRLT